MRFLVILGAAALAGACAGGPQVERRATLSATLTGTQAVPAGDRDGTGTAELRVDGPGGRVCWTLAVRGIAPATAAHVHRGAPGAAGPPVVTIETPGADGRSQGCTAVERALALEIAGRPSDFYLNVHTADHPAGAVRGQLRGRVPPPRGGY